jgi:hypothetical protein
MDDLESVYYVLFYVCYGHDLDGRFLQNPPNDLKQWTNPFLEPDALGNLKKGFLRDKIIPQVTRFQGKEGTIVKRLMDDLRQYFTPRLDKIIDALITDQADDSESDDPDGPNDSKCLLSDSPSTPGEDYSRFLALISRAIEKLEKLPLVPSSHPSPTGSQGSTSSKRLRSPEEDPATPPRKKRESCAPEATSSAQSMTSKARKPAKQRAPLPAADLDEENFSESHEDDEDWAPERGKRRGKTRRR